MMTTTEAKQAMALAVKEITLTLRGLFTLHRVEPELVETTATVLRQIFDRHQRELGARPAAAARAEMNALLDDIDGALSAVS